MLVISEEIDELFAISDRICVLADGRLSPQVALADTNIEQIGNWMSGNFAALPSGRAAGDTAARIKQENNLAQA